MLANLIGLRWIVTTGLMFAACSTWAATTSYFIYDESGHVIGEYDASGNPIQEHVYLGDRPVAVAVTNSGTTTVDYVTTDQLNTPRAITDSSKAVMWSWNSDPFGNGNPTGSLTYDLRFPGQQYDAETEHSYNYMRDYDSTTGRYVESDPFGLLAGTNTYDYVFDNPSRWIDSRGTVAEFHGGEGHFFLGGGLTSVTCKDNCGKKHTFRYWKICFGGAIGFGGGAGTVFGMDGDKCKESSYRGWFYELGGSYGPASAGADIGYNSDGSLSGVYEEYVGGGGGEKFKSSWCYYFPLGDGNY